MYLNEFNVGDVVVDSLGNVVEIKAIYQTGNVKIKTIRIVPASWDHNGVDVKSDKTYCVKPIKAENDWSLKCPEIPFENIDSEISTLETRLNELKSKKEKMREERLKKNPKIEVGKMYEIETSGWKKEVVVLSYDPDDGDVYVLTGDCEQDYFGESVFKNNPVTLLDSKEDREIARNILKFYNRNN